MDLNQASVRITSEESYSSLKDAHSQNAGKLNASLALNFKHDWYYHILKMAIFSRALYHEDAFKQASGQVSEMIVTVIRRV